MTQCFNEIFLESVDECLKEVLGNFTVDVLYFMLKKDFSLAFPDLSEKTEAFDECLKKIFGASGAMFLEREILRKLCVKLDLTYRDLERGFAVQVKLIEAAHQSAERAL